MIALGHTAIGTIIGISTYNLVGQGDLTSGLIIAGAAGVVSHYITDFIPHGHFVRLDKLKNYLMPIIAFDLLLPIILLLSGLYLKNGFTDQFFYILFGIGGAQLPDIFDGLIFINFIVNKGLAKKEYDFHQGLHWHGKDSKTLLLGALDIWQLGMVFVALYLTIFK